MWTAVTYKGVRIFISTETITFPAGKDIVFDMRMWNHLFAAPNDNYDHKQQTLKNTKQKQIKIPVGGGGGTLGICGWECATGTLQPLAYTRASSAEFCYPILE